MNNGLVPGIDESEYIFRSLRPMAQGQGSGIVFQKVDGHLPTESQLAEFAGRELGPNLICLLHRIVGIAQAPQCSPRQRVARARGIDGVRQVRKMVGRLEGLSSILCKRHLRRLSVSEFRSFESVFIPLYFPVFLLDSMFSIVLAG
ncbi:MAG TPA: hypothetical protein VKV17_17765, partial [Bryobacteraceae bacterium]|nr:hypothetical protein [Bryobacteraceae bacterium]